MAETYSICVMSCNDSIVHALGELTEAARTSAFPAEAAVVDGDILVGSLTDGDIRRFLLRNPISSLSDARVSDVMNKDPFSILEDRISEKDTLLAKVDRNFNAVFITDADGKFLYAIPRVQEDVTGSVDSQKVETIVIGLGFVGLTLAVHIADSGLDVVGIDISESHIERLKKFEVPFFEAGLEKKLAQHVGNGLQLTRQFEPSSRPRVFIVAVGTPVVNDKPDNSHLVAAVRDIATQLKTGDMVVVRSTVKALTCENEILPILEQETGLRCGQDFYFCMAPERTIEGLALQELSHLPQLIGAPDEKSLAYATAYFEQFCMNIIPLAGLAEAEFAKLLCNSWRDVSFAFANEFATVSEAFSIDAGALIEKCNLGYERARIPFPSPGVGGYCLTKDPFLYAASIRRSFDGTDMRPLSVVGRNINTKAAEAPDRALKNYIAKTGKQPAQTKVLIVGLAFKGKPDTDDLRHSTSVEFLERIKCLGYQVMCADAVVKEDALGAICDSILPLSEPVPTDVDAIFVLNNHNDNQFLVLDKWLDADKPKLFFDGWSLVSHLEGFMRTKNVDFKKMGVV